jgi:hypothetical protein
MTVHGTTKPITWDGTATFAGQDVTGSASFTTQLEEFGMQTPKVPLVLSIEPDITIEIDFHATRG